MEDIDIIIENYKKWAEKNGFSINQNKGTVDFLVKSLLEREQKFGKRYCPCRRITGNKKEDEKIVCPCIYMRKEIEEGGRCFCGLFVKKHKYSFKK